MFQTNDSLCRRFVSHFVILKICFVFAFWQQDSITLNKKQSLSHFLSLPFSLFCRNISSEFLNKGLLLGKPLYQLGASFSFAAFFGHIDRMYRKRIANHLTECWRNKYPVVRFFPQKKLLFLVTLNHFSYNKQFSTTLCFVFLQFLFSQFCRFEKFWKGFEKFWKSFESPVHIPVSGSGLHSGVLIELVEVASIRQMLSLFLFLLFMKRHLETRKNSKIYLILLWLKVQKYNINSSDYYRT